MAPGVTAAAYTWVPLLQGYAPSWNMRVEGYAARDGEDMEVANNIVSPGYWRTMGIPLVEGRDFDDRDRYSPADAQRGPSVAIVNRSFARRFFGGQSPIGRRFGVGEDKNKLGIQIIGVVPDALMAGPRTGPQPQVFFTFLQANFPVSATFYVRSLQKPDELGTGLHRLVAARDPALPILDLKTLSRQLDETLSAERLIAWLSVVFAALATVMAALGLYGVMAFSVARRTRELGLRVALGASSVSIVWLVMKEALTLLGAGIIIGLPSALFLGAYVASQLFGHAGRSVGRRRRGHHAHAGRARRHARPRRPCRPPRSAHGAPSGLAGRLPDRVRFRRRPVASWRQFSVLFQFNDTMICCVGVPPRRRSIRNLPSGSTS